MFSVCQFPLERYSEVRNLGIQGSGKVYELKRGHEPKIEIPKNVTVKTTELNNQDDLHDSNCMEVNILKDLQHPNVIGYFGHQKTETTGSEGPKVNLIMEFCPFDLATLMEQRSTTFSPQEATYLIKQVLEGVVYLHRSDIAHRNINSANIMIIVDQEDPDWNSINVWEIKVKLAGFTHARKFVAADSQMHSMKALRADVLSKSPEVLENLFMPGTRNNYGKDLIDVGKILYELVTGTKYEDSQTNDKILLRDSCPNFGEFLQSLLLAEKPTQSSAILKHAYIAEAEIWVKDKRQNWEIEQLRNQMLEMNRKHEAEVKRLDREVQAKTKEIQEEQKKQAELERQVQMIMTMLGQKVHKSLTTQQQEAVDRELYHTASRGDVYGIKVALARGATLEGKDRVWKETPLSGAARNGCTTAIKYLINEGAEVNTTDKYEQTPLYNASRNGRDQAISLLLSNGADLEKTNKDKRTPLMVAAFHGHVSSVSLLLEKGAGTRARDSCGYTALDLAGKFNGNKRADTVKVLAEWQKGNQRDCRPLLTTKPKQQPKLVPNSNSK